MNTYLLDGVGGAFLLIFFGAAILFLLIAILVESFIMKRMKFTDTINKAILISFVANLVSTIAGWLLADNDNEHFNLGTVEGFGLLFLVTVVLEFIVMKLFSKTQTLQRTLLVCVVMNLATYAIAALFILMFVKN